jgi:hypothetical protein
VTTDTALLLKRRKPGTGRVVLPPAMAAFLRGRNQYAADASGSRTAAVAAGPG